jgi:hypothetical protein
MNRGAEYFAGSPGEKTFFECFKEGTAPLPFSQDVVEP